MTTSPVRSPIGQQHRGKDFWVQVWYEKAHTCAYTPPIGAATAFGRTFFSWWSNAMRPPRSEKPHRCDYCSKAFSFGSELRRHTRTHTDKRPYECGYCGKVFWSGDTLKVHIRTHTVKRPYRCVHCGRSFSDGSYRNKHSHTHGWGETTPSVWSVR